MTEPKVMHLNDWGATAMLHHALERIPDAESCIVLFYEDGELSTLSSHVSHQQAVWMYELAKLQALHTCIPHEWEEA